MPNQTPNGDRLVQRWVEVRDTNGRVHLEARWELATSQAPAPATHGHAA